MAPDLYIRTKPQQDARLGRQCVHDPRSLDFEHQPRALGTGPDLLVQRWRHRIYNPRPLPAQRIGCCTGVDQAIKANARGNRVAGNVLDLRYAELNYTIASAGDPFPGQWPPTDTGSSALAACKASVQLGVITGYEWMRSVRAVLQALRERPVGVGTWWHASMFHPDPRTLLVRPTGGIAGGHQWTLIGWEPELKAFEGLCWWGTGFGDRGMFRIRYDDLGELLADDGDAHVTYRSTTAWRP